ncbi:POL1 protein, partial [Geococcyx californianus]|nr:POL1 protein [Geococcyx californianus]
WQRLLFTEPGASVQSLEAIAVAEALQRWTHEHLNVVTDSMFVFRLLQSMTYPGLAGSEIAIRLEAALQKRRGTASIIHINSHTAIKGLYQDGNDKADKAAQQIWTVKEAKLLHEKLHIGAKALAKHCNIPITQAKDIISTCPYCQN